MDGVIIDRMEIEVAETVMSAQGRVLATEFTVTMALTVRGVRTVGEVASGLEQALSSRVGGPDRVQA